MVYKTIKSKDKFVIALTVQNLIEEGYKFSENDNGELLVKDGEGDLKLFKFETDFLKWINEKSLDF